MKWELFVFVLFVIGSVNAFSEALLYCGDGVISSGESRLNCCVDTGCGYSQVCDVELNKCVPEDSYIPLDSSKSVAKITGYSAISGSGFSAAYLILLGVVVLFTGLYYTRALKP